MSCEHHNRREWNRKTKKSEWQQWTLCHESTSTNYCTSCKLKNSSQNFYGFKGRGEKLPHTQTGGWLHWKYVCGFKRNSTTHTTLLLPHLKWTFNSIPLLFQFDSGYLVYTPRLFNEVSNHYFPLSISLMKKKQEPQKKNYFTFTWIYEKIGK